MPSVARPSHRQTLRTNHPETSRVPSSGHKNKGAGIWICDLFHVRIYQKRALPVSTLDYLRCRGETVWYVSWCAIVAANRT